MENMLKMAFFDQNCSLIKVNFGQFFTGLKFAQKIAIFLGEFISLKNRHPLLKVAQLAKNRPIWSPWSECCLSRRNKGCESQDFIYLASLES
jgi:hypothetical protein